MKQTLSIVKAKEAWAEGRFLDCGQALYEPMQPQERVNWAANLLMFCMQYSPSLPAIDRVVELAKAPSDWRLAHAAFNEVRRMTLVAEARDSAIDPGLKSLLFVAETTAKVIYNASGEPAPFDANAGWQLVPCVEHFLATIAVPAATEGGVQLIFAQV
jgi:hypothetical protein